MASLTQRILRSSPQIQMIGMYLSFILDEDWRSILYLLSQTISGLGDLIHCSYYFCIITLPLILPLYSPLPCKKKNI